MGAIVIGPLWLQRPFSNRPARKLAQLSYGLYLIHLPVAIVVAEVVLGLPTDGSPAVVGVWLGVVIAVSLVYPELSRRWLERPLIERSRRRVERRRARRGKSLLERATAAVGAPGP